MTHKTFSVSGSKEEWQAALAAHRESERVKELAPDLLRLVEDIEQSLTADNTYRLLREACRDLIAKANGGGEVAMTDDRPEILCPACEGEGAIEHPFLTQVSKTHAESPPDPMLVDCDECDGTGWRPMTDDEWSDTSEAAYERSLEGEPPVSLDEQHRAAWQLKQELRR